MKRKTTSLEEYLISIGLRLVSKTYFGKNSEFTENYIYRGCVAVDGRTYINVQVELDYKRENIDMVSLVNTFPATTKITKEFIEDLSHYLGKIEDLIRHKGVLEMERKEQEEIAEIVGEINDSCEQ